MAAAEKCYRVQSLQFQGPVYDDLLMPLQTDRMRDVPRQLLVEGPTGTGKSMGLGGFMKAYMRKYPGVNCLVLRRIKADLAGSFMSMWEEEILDWTDPWDRWMLTGDNGQVPSHRSRDVYKYPNGSKLWCRGMDQWARVKSMAYAVIWMMEGTEFEEEQLQGLYTRIRKRRSDPDNLPWRGLICDTNPEHPGHWLNQRAIRGEIHRMTTTLEDNPAFWDRVRKVWRPVGEEYRQDLRGQLKGHAYARYVNGEWVAAEGQILDWDEERQTFEGEIKRRPGQRDRIEFRGTHPVLGNFVELRGYAASYDWGLRHAGTFQVWGVDDAGRQYLVEEVYMSERPLHWWADWAVTLWKKWGFDVIVCDSAAADTIAHFNHELQKQEGAHARIAVKCDKRSGNREKSNLEVLQEAFADDRDGKPWVFLKKDALAHGPDSNLNVKRFEEEIPGYVYAEYEPGRHSGRPEERPARNCVDDGLDACCYMRVYLLGGRTVRERVTPGGAELNPRRAVLDYNWKRKREMAS